MPSSTAGAGVFGHRGTPRVRRRRALTRPRGSGRPGTVELRRRDTTLEIRGTCSASTTGRIADASASTTRRAAEDVRTAVDWAGRLGVGAILVPSSCAPNCSARTPDRCTTAFASLCHAAERGVTASVSRTVARRRRRLRAGRVSSPGFGCYFDLANPLRRGLDSATEIRALGDLHPASMWTSVRRRATSAPAWNRNRLRRVRPSAGRDRLRRLTRSRRRPRRRRSPGGTASRSAFPRLRADSRVAEVRRHVPQLFRGCRRTATELASSRLVSVARRRAPGGVRRGPGARGSGRKLLDEAGVSVAGLAGYRNLVAPDPAIRTANLDYIMLPRAGPIARHMGRRHRNRDEALTATGPTRRTIGETRRGGWSTMPWTSSCRCWSRRA